MMTISSESDAGAGPAVATRRRNWLLRLGLVVYVLQTAGALGMYFHHHRARLETVMRVYGTDAPWPGVGSPLLVTRMDATTGRATDGSVVGVSWNGQPVTLEPGPAGPEGRIPASNAAGELEVSSPDGTPDGRRVSVVVSPALPGDHLSDPARLGAASTLRRAELGDGSDQPRAWVRDADDLCARELTVSVNGGVVARGLPNTIRLRLVDGAGAPVARAALRLRPREATDAREPVVLRTDALGIATWEAAVVPAPESWMVSIPCGDAPEVERRLSIIPSWDGVVLRAEPVVFGGRRLTAQVTHQRAWGDWYLDVHCDGAWIESSIAPVREGTSEFQSRVTLPTVERPTWCTVTASLRRHASDPPRAQVNVLIVPEGEGGVGLWASLTSALAEHLEHDAAPSAAPLALAALQRASDDELRTYGRWLLDAMPHVVRPPALLLDDAGGASSSFLDRRARILGTLSLTLLLDAVILLIGVIGVVAPAAQAQRERLRAALEDPTLEWGDADADSLDRPMVAGALGVLVVLASLLGLLALLLVLQ